MKAKIGLFLLIHGVLSLVLGVVARSATAPDWSWSFLWGQAFCLLSLVSLSLSVYFILLKKNIALLVAVIVFKWPILMVILYWLSQSSRFIEAAFSFGFLPVFFSALIWSAVKKG